MALSVFCVKYRPVPNLFYENSSVSSHAPMHGLSQLRLSLSNCGSYLESLCPQMIPPVTLYSSLVMLDRQ